MELSVSKRNKSWLGTHSIGELIEVRKALEVSNAAIAAEKRTSDDLHKLEQILDGMAFESQQAEGEKADALFHMTIARSTHNSVLVRLMEVVFAHLEAAVRDTRKVIIHAYKPVSQQILREHRDIYQAIREHNAYLAQEKMKQHLFHVERVLLRFAKALPLHQ